MSTPGDGNTDNTTAAVATAVDEGLGCPRCQYNLRGLTGDPVTCPECGLRCGRALLHTLQIQMLSVGRLPCYAKLRNAALVGVGLLLAFLFIWAIDYPVWRASSPVDSMIVTMPILALLVMWTKHLFGAWKTFGSGYGLVLALLVQLKFILIIIVTLVVLMYTLLFLANATAPQGSFISVDEVFTVVTLVLAGVSAMGVVELHRYIRQSCLRWHLAHVMAPAAAATTIALSREAPDASLTQ